MIEILEGTGTLSQEKPSARWKVTYRFQIDTRIVTRPGMPPAVGKSSSLGTIEAVSGETLPMGIFELDAEDGEILKVKNLGVGWAILAPG